MNALQTMKSRLASNLREHWVDTSAGLVVLIICAVLVWPAPLGTMPLSGDHPVHLARAVLTAEQLSMGRLAGWSERWFLGFPIGELYPQLGDLLVIAIAGLTRVSWPTAYAWAFFLIFSAQSLALLRAGRVIGLGVVPGLVAALCCCFDLGAYREGGWIYTVSFGVWPQGLSNSLMWLGLAELWASRETSLAQDSRRHLVVATVCLSLCVLAHPIAIPLLVVALPLLIVMGTLLLPVPGTASGSLASLRTAFADQCSRVGWVVIFSIGLCAWFVVPMLLARGYMASYGWLHVDLRLLGTMASKGVWAQNMPPAVGTAVALGLALAVLRPLGFLRFSAVFALLLWMLSASDTFWYLRLDWLSDSFSHLQYQRFLTAAKPGLWLCAGAVLGQLWVLSFDLAQASQGSDLPSATQSPTSLEAPPLAQTPSTTAQFSKPMLRLGAIVSAAGFAVLTMFIAQQVARRFEKSELGQLVTQRVPPRGAPVDDDVMELFSWLEQRWTESEVFYRVSIEISRNEHWLMDAPVYTHTPIYRAGFTPGDNFVHKPESTREEVLDAARVRFRIVRSAIEGPLREEVAAFGTLRVLERPQPVRAAVWIESDPISNLNEDLEKGGARATLEGGASARPRVDSHRTLARGIHSLVSAPAASLGGPLGPRTTTEELIAEVSPQDLILGERESARWLVFSVAGHPRWHLYKDGQEIGWVERALYGTATPVSAAERGSGKHRGGKANGDDGSEPTLVAINVTKSGPGHYELRYHTRQQTHGWLGLVALVSALALWVASREGSDRGGTLVRARDLVGDRLLALIAKAAHPIVLALALGGVAAVLVPRVMAHRLDESHRLIGLATQAGRTEVHGFSRGLIKTEMRIEPALMYEHPDRGPSSVLVRNLKIAASADEFAGWVAFDDDDAKIGRRGDTTFSVRVRSSNQQEWTEVYRAALRQRPGKHHFVLDLTSWDGQSVDVRVELRGDGQSRAGMDIDFTKAITP